MSSQAFNNLFSVSPAEVAAYLAVLSRPWAFGLIQHIPGITADTARKIQSAYVKAHEKLERDCSYIKRGLNLNYKPLSVFEPKAFETDKQREDFIDGPHLTICSTHKAIHKIYKAYTIPAHIASLVKQTSGNEPKVFEEGDVSSEIGPGNVFKYLTLAMDGIKCFGMRSHKMEARFKEWKQKNASEGQSVKNNPVEAARVERAEKIAKLNEELTRAQGKASEIILTMSEITDQINFHSNEIDEFTAGLQYLVEKELKAPNQMTQDEKDMLLDGRGNIDICVSQIKTLQDELKRMEDEKSSVNDRITKLKDDISSLFIMSAAGDNPKTPPEKPQNDGDEKKGEEEEEKPSEEDSTGDISEDEIGDFPPSSFSFKEIGEAVAKYEAETDDKDKFHPLLLDDLIKKYKAVESRSKGISVPDDSEIVEGFNREMQIRCLTIRDGKFSHEPKIPKDYPIMKGSKILNKDNELTLDARMVLVSHTKINPDEVNPLLAYHGSLSKHLSRDMTLQELSKTIRLAFAGKLPEEYTPPEKDEGSSSVGKVLKKVAFSESMRMKVKVNDKLKAIMETAEVVKFEVAELRLKLHKYEFSPKGVADCIKTNELSFDVMKDIFYAGIVVALCDAGMLPTTDGDIDEASKDEAALITKAKMTTIMRLTRMVLKVALHAYSHGLIDNTIKWYDSFVEVSGNFISETRLANLCRAINSAGSMHMLMDVLTVGDILGQNPLYTYRLTRLSSPALVREALRIMPYDEVLSHFDLHAVNQYIDFNNTGVLAQIAAGPLSVYCRGRVNPLVVDDIPKDLKLSELEALPSAPYHAPTLRRAKIILDEIDFQHGKWFQGEKALRTMTPADLRFKMKVRRIVEALKNTADVTGSTKEEILAQIGTEYKYKASDLSTIKSKLA